MEQRNPEQILKAINACRKDETRGKLKIFFGYAAGVGKTYAMLEAAHEVQQRGADVVAGYIEPHARPQTMALMEGLEVLPVREAQTSGIRVREFDLDAALKRKPALILVDELAHTNAPGSRHAKRCQDIEELLRAGIDVYTTVNVQHLESLNDTVAGITGVLVRERFPDSVFDQADQVEMVDIEPADLLERMAEGKVYGKEQAERARLNFFTLDNLTALREIALRRSADRVNLRTEAARIQSGRDYPSEESVLVCLSSSPTNARLIRTASRMARAFKGRFTALYVETSAADEMSEDDQKRLGDNTHLARQLGAEVETVYGEDVPYQIAEFARLSGVSKLVIGRSAAARKGLFPRPSLTERLIALAPHLDIYVIPDASVQAYRPPRKKSSRRLTGRDLLICLAGLGVVTLLGLGFQELGYSEANIVTIYIFGVLVIAVLTSSQWIGLLASLLSVVIFSFFFTVPRFDFQFYEGDYLVTFVIMFLVAFLSGSLARRLQENARTSAQAAFRTKILLETNQLLQKAASEEAVLQETAGQIEKLLDRALVVYPPAGNTLGKPVVYPGSQTPDPGLTSENEKAVAEWVFHNNKHAGASTSTLSSAKCFYLAIRQAGQVHGVLGIHLPGPELDAFETSIVLSILGECALALENLKNLKEKEEAELLARNEQLRANLLRSISHDLRTPLTSISGSAANLMSNYRRMDESTREQTFTDIYDDSMWLINLVENLLSITRIENQEIRLNRSVELMDEVVSEALAHISRRASEYEIEVRSESDLLLASIDAKLIVQVLTNLIDNAIKYTPAGSKIEIGMRQRENWIEVSVADNGPGIPDEQKEHIFEMFYSGSDKVADSRRSFGLGLALCKSIVQAHGGDIHVADRYPSGTVFTFTLPAGEVELHE